MATGFLSPIGMIVQLLSDQGVVGNGFKINTYVGGSVNTPQQTFTDSTLVTPNSNPIIMGTNGRFQNVSVWAASGILIKMVITDALNNPLVGGTIDNLPLINDVVNSIAFFNKTAAETAAGVTVVNFGYPPGTIDRYGTNTTPGTTDMTSAINAAMNSWNGKGGTVTALQATYLATASLKTPFGIALVGQGFSDSKGTGAGNRGPSCLLRGFAGSTPFLIISGDNCSLDMIDIDGNLQGALSGVTFPDNIVVIGSRCRISARVSSRNAAHDCVRVGMTTGQTTPTYPVAAGTNNTNLWDIGNMIAYSAAYNGVTIEDTNTVTSLNYPIGLPNVNGGRMGAVDAQSCGLDGLRIGNALDISVQMGVCQSNGTALALTVAPVATATSGTLTANWLLATGIYSVVFTETATGNFEIRYVTLTNGATTATWAAGGGSLNSGLSANCNAAITVGAGIHLATDGINSGTRMIQMLCNDTESNVGPDLQIDSGTLPASGPGGYHIILGNRGGVVTLPLARFAIDPAAVVYWLRWDTNPGVPGIWHAGGQHNIVSPLAGGSALLNLYADVNYALDAQIAASGATQGRLALRTRLSGTGLLDALVMDNNQNTTFSALALTYKNAAPTIASAATIAPTLPVSFVSGIVTINTITASLPNSCNGLQITLIPTGLWSTGVTGNIAIATTAVVSKALVMTYDTATSKWYPSY